MDEAATPPSTASALLASAGRARATRLLTGTWWVATGLLALLAYGSTAAEAGLIAPVGGALFVAGMCVVAVVARNASAEAREPGSVRRGSVLRAATFGIVVHGGLLAAVTVFASSPMATVLWVLIGGAGVALMRPTTLVALNATSPLPSRAPGPLQSSVPQIVAELRSSAEQVRATTDPVAKAALAQRRGELIELLAERDPDALALLLDDSAVRPKAAEGPDGPLPA